MVPAEFVRKQVNAGLEDVGADVVKIGETLASPCPSGMIFQLEFVGGT